MSEPWTLVHEALALAHHANDEDPALHALPWRECPWSKDHTAFAYDAEPGIREAVGLEAAA